MAVSTKKADPESADQIWDDAYCVYSHGTLRRPASTPEEAIKACDAAGVHLGDDLLIVPVKVVRQAAEPEPEV